MSSEPRIVSFVIRFVYEEQNGEPPAEKSSGWYSVIRHIQTNTERRFASWPETVAFISKYVDLNREGGAG